MRKYLRVFSLKIKDMNAFSTDFYFSLIVVPIQVIIVYLFWRGTIDAREVGGFTVTELGLYFLFLQLLQMVFAPGVIITWELWQEINKGNILIWMTKRIYYPFYVFLQKLAEFFVKYIVAILFMGVPILFYLKYDLITRLIFGGIASILGFCILFEIFYIIGVLTFWLGNVLTLRDNVMNLMLLLGGQLLPVSMLPRFIQTISWLTPLPYIYYLPANIYVDRYLSFETFGNIVINQLIWIIGLALGIFILWRQGLNRYNPQGG